MTCTDAATAKLIWLAKTDAVLHEDFTALFDAEVGTLYDGRWNCNEDCPIFKLGLSFDVKSQLYSRLLVNEYTPTRLYERVLSLCNGAVGICEPFLKIQRLRNDARELDMLESSFKTIFEGAR